MSRVPHPSVASLEIRCQKMEPLIKICAHFGFESKLQNNANLSTLCGVKNDGFAKKMYLHVNNILYIDFLQNEGQSAKTVVQTPAGSKRVQMLKSDEAAAIYSKCTLPSEFLTTLFHEVLVSGLWKQQEKLLLDRLVCGCTDPGARLHLLLHNCQLPSRLSRAKLNTAHKIPRTN